MANNIVDYIVNLKTNGGKELEQLAESMRNAERALSGNKIDNADGKISASAKANAATKKAAAKDNNDSASQQARAAQTELSASKTAEQASKQEIENAKNSKKAAKDLKEAAADQEKAADSMSKNSGSGGFASSLEKISEVASVAGGHLGTLGQIATDASTKLGAIGVAVGAAAAAVGLLAQQFLVGLGEIIEDDGKLARLNALVESTGNAAGKTGQELQDMAGEIEGATMFDGADLQDAAGILTGFTSVTEENFRRILELSADVAEVMGSSVQGAVVSLGKAFEDPIAGMASLSKQGVALSDSQKDVVKSLLDSNEKLAAQNYLYEQLKAQLGGGAAEGARDSIPGRVKELAESWKELRQEMADSTGIADWWKRELEILAGSARLATRAMKNYAESRKNMAELVERQSALELRVQENPDGFFGGLNKKMLERVNKERADLQAELDKDKESEKVSVTDAAGNSGEVEKGDLADEALRKKASDKLASLNNIQANQQFTLKIGSANTKAEINGILKQLDAFEEAYKDNQKQITIANDEASKERLKASVAIEKTKNEEVLKDQEASADQQIKSVELQVQQGVLTEKQGAEEKKRIMFALNETRADAAKAVYDGEAQLLKSDLNDKQAQIDDATAKITAAIEEIAKQSKLTDEQKAARQQELIANDLTLIKLKNEYAQIEGQITENSRQRAQIDPVKTNQNAAFAVDNTAALAAAREARQQAVSDARRAASEKKREEEKQLQSRIQLENMINNLEIEHIRLTGNEREASAKTLEEKYRDLYEKNKKDVVAIGLIEKAKNQDVINEKLRVEQAHEKRMQSIRSEYLKAQGRDHEAQMFDLKAKYKEAITAAQGNAEEIGLIDKLFNVQQAEANIDEIFRQIEEKRRLYEQGLISREEYQNAVKDLGDQAIGEAEKTGSQKTETETEDKVDIEKGKAGLNELKDLGVQVGSTLYSSLSGAFDGLIDGTETAGEAFKKMGLSILKTLTQVLLNLIVIYALQQLTGFAGGGSTTMGGILAKVTSGYQSAAGLNHDGGRVGSPSGGWTRQVPSAIFDNAPRYHTGGIAGLKPNEVPTILEKGEYVATETDPLHPNNQKAGGSGGNNSGGGITINNVLDNDMLAKTMETPAGERVFQNLIQKNASLIKNLRG